jgi:hypothetical protein
LAFSGQFGEVGREKQKARKSTSVAFSGNSEVPLQHVKMISGEDWLSVVNLAKSGSRKAKSS